MRVLLVAGAGAGGWIVTFLVVRRPPGVLLRPPHARENFRGRTVAGTLGMVLLAPLWLGAGISVVAGGRTGLVAAGAGTVMGVVGLLDDLYAEHRAGGFAGHLRALRHGRVTTGLAKAVTGGLVGLGAAWLLGLRGVWVVAGGMLVALAANLVNLVDLRPGRAGKVWLVGYVLLVAAAPAWETAVAVTALAGGVVAFLPSDLRERGMLGDTGANLLGATVGTAALTALGRVGLMATLAGLVVLTAVSEVVSFSRVIERVPVLRIVDSLGRKP